MCCCCGESGGHRRPEYERNLAGDFFHRFRTDYPLCVASLLFFGTLAAGLVTELPAPVRIGGVFDRLASGDCQTFSGIAGTAAPETVLQ